LFRRLYPQAQADIVAETYEAFDQTPGRGWRALAEDAKYQEAATRLEADAVTVSGQDQPAPLSRPSGVMRVLAISGSLRAASINSALLRAAARLAPPEVEITLLSGIGELPLFNLDLELQLPPQVAGLRAEVAAADALLIASPEYAHGVTGTIKNTLDWLVGFEAFVYKPVAVLNVSPRAHHADSALRETLKTMSAVIVEAASVSIPLLGVNLTESGMMESQSVSQAIRASLAALYRAVVLQQSEQSPTFPLP